MSENAELARWAVSPCLNWRLRRLQSVVAFRPFAVIRYATGSLNSSQFFL